MEEDKDKTEELGDIIIQNMGKLFFLCISILSSVNLAIYVTLSKIYHRTLTNIPVFLFNNLS